jgi:hypothetical protein|tara:strand:+ start:6874 stop:7398 length:525 start_codon:yes stop_codon:yes gene_type:complete
MDQQDILSSLQQNINSNSALDTLMQVDGTLDRLNVYAYKNWIEGEIIDGPTIDRYWVTLTLMYPRKLMPDPDGAERIIKWGGKVFYAKEDLHTAAKMVDPEDRETPDNQSGMRPGQGRAKKVTRPIWLVTLILPRETMDKISTSEKRVDDMSIDTDSVEAAYDDGLGDDDAIQG